MSLKTYFYYLKIIAREHLGMQDTLIREHVSRKDT